MKTRITAMLAAAMMTAWPALAHTTAEIRQSAMDQLDPFASGEVRAAAIATLEGLAGQGDTASSDVLGAYFAGVYGGTPDMAQALPWYQQAAARNDPAAIDFLCAAYAGDHTLAADWAMAVPWCRKGADARSPDSLAYLGEAYAYGYGGLTADVPHGLDLLNQAVASSTPALNILGRIDYDGRLAPQDYVAARTLAQQALVRGSLDSLPWLAVLYDQGLGLPAEPAEGARLHYYSAQFGQADGQAWLSAHPEISEEGLKANDLSVIKIEGGPYTVARVAADGTRQPVDAAQVFFQSFAEMYPERAQDNEIEGTVIADCHWNGDGNLDNCIVLDETPPGYGFARATLKTLSRPFAVDQADAWKSHVAGHSFHFVMKWMLG